jgi:hypothetical protein
LFEWRVRGDVRGHRLWRFLREYRERSHKLRHVRQCLHWRRGLLEWRVRGVLLGRHDHLRQYLRGYSERSGQLRRVQQRLPDESGLLERRVFVHLRRGHDGV